MARAEVMADEYSRLIQARMMMPESVHLRAMLTTGRRYRELSEKHGPFENLGPKIKRRIAASLYHDAGPIRQTDIGGCWGLVLLAMWLESGSLPGDTARKIYHKTASLVETSVIAHDASQLPPG